MEARQGGALRTAVLVGQGSGLGNGARKGPPAHSRRAVESGTVGKGGLPVRLLKRKKNLN